MYRRRARSRALRSGCTDTRRAPPSTVRYLADSTKRPFRSRSHTRPTTEDRYTVRECLVDRKIRSGWPPGIQPLLAALGGTPDNERDTSYRSSDHRDFSKKLAGQ